MTRVAPWFVVALLLALAAPKVFADPLHVLGAFDPGSAGYNASAVGLDGVAYLGSWGGPAQCPSLGVRVFDIHDPTAPVPLGSVAVYQGKTAEPLGGLH